jgi:hypothetical protein
METTWSSETLVDFQRAARCYILEERNVHNHRCERLWEPQILMFAIEDKAKLDKENIRGLNLAVVKLTTVQVTKLPL